MIQLFKIGSVERLLLLFGLFACMHLPYLLFDEQVLVQELLRLRLGERLADGWHLYAQAADDTAPLSALIYGILARIGFSDFYSLRIAGSVLIWFQAIWFNQMAIRYQLVSERNYLLAFFYLILVHCAADTASLSPALMAISFLLLSLNKLFVILRDDANAEEAMLAGLYLGLAIITHQSFAIFIFPLLLACLFFSGLKVNHYILLMAAALFPSFIFYTWFSWNGGLSEFTRCFAAGFRLIPSLVLCPLPAILYPGALLLLFSFAGWIFANQHSRVNVQRMGFTVFFFLGVAASAGVFLGSMRSTENLLLLLLPASFFLAQTSLLNKSRLFNEILGISILVLVIGNFYFQNEGPVRAWNQNLYAAEPPKGFTANFPGKKLLLLSNDFRFYKYNPAAGPHLRFYMSRLQPEIAGTYEGLILWYQCLEEDPPEIIYDPNKLIPGIAEHIPEFRRCYKASFYPDLFIRVPGKVFGK